MALLNGPAAAAVPTLEQAAAPEPIPWTQLGATATARYSGEGLTVTPTEHGARLRCVFQRLDCEATRDGLWLVSTATDFNGQCFQIVATSVGREANVGDLFNPALFTFEREVARSADESVLPSTGTVEVKGNMTRFIRPGLIEEYSVSMDGVRQDFVVLEKPEGAGELQVRLAVTGARVEPIAGGAQLVLEKSGRKIAYSRLRVTDATGKELTARMDVAAFRQSSAEMKQEDDGGLPTRRYVCLAVIVEDAHAVYPIRIDPTFSDANWISMNPSIPGADDAIRAAVVDGLGNLYIGGQFTLVGDVFANYIAKWDGSGWSALGSGTDFYVNALAVSGSDLYVGGIFTTAGGVSATNIAKWNGSSWSALGTGISAPNSYPYYGGSVDALEVSGNDLYAGGWFSAAGGSAATNIAKWNGSSWSKLGSGINGSVSALAASGSILYAGGFFTTAGGVSASKIAKWNGSSWSALGLGMGGGNYNNEVLALAVSGGDLYAAGLFQMAGGIAATNIAKWNGNSWSPLGAGTDGYVFALAASGGGVYAAGHFKSAGGSPASRIAKWDGSSWSALSSAMNGTVYGLAVSGNNLYAGGDFTSAGGSAANRIAKWNESSWSALGLGMNNAVLALASSGSDLYVAGWFTMAGGVPANGIAKWNGSSWSPLGSGMDDLVYALSVSGTEVYAAGKFTNAGGVFANRIARWDGSSWSPLDSGMNELVYALAMSGSNLYAAGAFTNADGVPANCIAKWDGSAWSALGSGMRHAGQRPVIRALAVSGNELYAGGEFTTAGGLTANNIAKWDGSGWTALGSGLDFYVEALAVSGSNLYAGGWFSIAGGITARSIAQWNGNTWMSLGSGMEGRELYDGPTVFALAVSGNNLYVGGQFSGADGSPANFIAKWNGSSWSELGSGMNNPVYALAASDNDLYAAGSFTTAGGKVSAYLARAVLSNAPGYNQITNTLLSGGAMQFSYVGYPATNYALDRTFNLSSPSSWVGQRTNTMTVSGVLMFTNTPVTDTNNFWRVRSVP